MIAALAPAIAEPGAPCAFSTGWPREKDYRKRDRHISINELFTMNDRFRNCTK